MAPKQNLDFRSFRDIVIKRMSGQECPVRIEIGKTVQSVPRTPGTESPIHPVELHAWLHEAPLPAKNPKEYDLLGRNGLPRELAPYLSKLRCDGSGSKKLAAAFYYRLHVHPGYAKYAQRVDRVAFKGQTFKEAVGQPVFHFDDVEEVSPLAKFDTPQAAQFSLTSADSGLIKTHDEALLVVIERL